MDSLLRPPFLAKLTGLAIAYALSIKLVLAYLTADGVVSIVWLPSGLGFAALLVGGRKYWPGIFCGAFAAYFLIGRPLLLDGLVAASNVIEPLCGLWLLARDKRFDPTLPYLRDFFSLAAAGVVSAGLAAVIGVGGLLSYGWLEPGGLLKSLRLWWMGNCMGIIVVTPLLLVWRSPPKEWFGTYQRVAAALLFLTLTVLCGQYVFLEWWQTTPSHIAAAFWMFLFAAWGAVRYGRHGALFVVGLVSIQALLGALSGKGYFRADMANTGLVAYWLYILILTFVSLSLALVIESRARALDAARMAQKEMSRLLSQAEQSRHVLLSVIEDQKVAEAALMAERNLRQRYLDMVEAVIIALDIRGYITLVNRKGCIVLGYDEEELLGRNWFADCLPQPEGLAEDYQAFQQAIQGTLREVEHYEYEILTRLGERRLIAWHTTVLRDGQGHITGLLCAGDDISEQRQAEWQLSAQLDELRRWQSLTFGRENRVLELKLEVNALLAEQGKPPRYSSAGKMAAEHRQ